jgi:hypothetical protein
VSDEFLLKILRRSIADPNSLGRHFEIFFEELFIAALTTMQH